MVLRSIQDSEHHHPSPPSRTTRHHRVGQTTASISIVPSLARLLWPTWLKSEPGPDHQTIQGSRVISGAGKIDQSWFDGLLLGRPLINLDSVAGCRSSRAGLSAWAPSSQLFFFLPGSKPCSSLAQSSGRLASTAVEVGQRLSRLPSSQDGTCNAINSLCRVACCRPSLR